MEIASETALNDRSRANTSVTYRTDLAPEYVGKESWKILFDPKYKGRVAGLDGVDDTVTLIAKTWDIDPYNMTPEQWTTLQGKLREFVAAARFISSDETSLSQGLASGEIVAAITWNQTPTALKKEIQKQKEYLAKTLETLRNHVLPAGSEPGFVFRPMRARRGGGKP